MRCTNRLSRTFISIGVLFMLQTAAQSPSDSALNYRSLTQSFEIYTNSDAARGTLYNGPLYGGYDHHPQGHPFFLSDTLLPGSILYGGVLFPDIRLSYDIARDVVIMRNEVKDIIFQLIPEKLPYFTIAQHQFIYLASDSSAVNMPESGFYEELYHGKTAALCRHEKTIQMTGKAEENLSIYHQYNFYYLEMNGRYYAIHSERNLLNVFGSDKVNVREFMKKFRLSFRKDPGTTLSRVAAYYSELKK
jgi:hypothetical protein